MVIKRSPYQTWEAYLTTQLDNVATPESPPIIVRLSPVIEITDDQFYAFCQLNRDLQIERATTGELIIMPPIGGEGSRRNADITTELNLWNRTSGLGIVFDSSGGFSLPQGGNRSPDAAWLSLERWQALTPVQRQKFLPLSPDFVIELRA